ncbi:MAG: aminopeptidase [Caldisericia bacterium]|jgi:aspartyl aminopeptidase|nr:aminopeptidase [Caldisericia bacterium]
MEVNELKLKKKNVWEEYKEEEIEKVSKEYIKFISESKTERESVEFIEKILIENGYKNIDEESKGDKLYKKIKNKSILILKKGEKDLKEGFNLVTAHIDSPRIDLKQNPLYEDTNLAFFETHYYGGIKKYQWVSIPLVLKGVIIKKDGGCLKIDSERDGIIFSITDLLPHLARKQYEKKIGEAIEGENLNVLIGSKPLKDEKEEKIKANILKYLNEKYGITEEDFISSELTLVPYGEAKEIGFDKSMILGYGHDDRSCAFSAFYAILNSEKPKRWSIVYLIDKEEIGSEGNTSAQSIVFDEILLKFVNDYKELISIYSKSSVLSGDVNAAFDPNYKEVYEPKNSAYINNGVVMTKFTGRGGKYESNDASAEYVGKIRKLLNENGVIWQVAELGKVDEGGGGTVAMFFARKGMDVIDMGPAVLSMHAPFEIISKGDLFATYHSYKVFIERFE